MSEESKTEQSQEVQKWEKKMEIYRQHWKTTMGFSSYPDFEIDIASKCLFWKAKDKESKEDWDFMWSNMGEIQQELSNKHGLILAFPGRNTGLPECFTFDTNRERNTVKYK